MERKGKIMNLNEVREKNKNLLQQWRILKKEIEPLNNECMAQFIESGIEPRAIPYEKFRKLSALKEKENKIFNEILKIYEALL